MSGGAASRGCPAGPPSSRSGRYRTTAARRRDGRGLCHIHSPELPQDKGDLISSREKEVLGWLKQGKSSWEISVILNISERTVNFHIYNIMQKLEAVNRPHAVAVAASLGLIEFD
ncbi:MAG: helix-turn-helix domain-containing protein [Solirubrobacteraceae bacterium]